MPPLSDGSEIQGGAGSNQGDTSRRDRACVGTRSSCLLSPATRWCSPLLWSFPLSCRIFPETNIVFLNHISWNHFKSSLLLTLGPSTKDMVKRGFKKGIPCTQKQVDHKWMTTWGQWALAPLKFYFLSFKALHTLPSVIWVPNTTLPYPSRMTLCKLFPKTRFPHVGKEDNVIDYFQIGEIK